MLWFFIPNQTNIVSRFVGCHRSCSYWRLDFVRSWCTWFGSNRACDWVDQQLSCWRLVCCSKSRCSRSNGVCDSRAVACARMQRQCNWHLRSQYAYARQTAQQARTIGARNVESIVGKFSSRGAAVPPLDVRIARRTRAHRNVWSDLFTIERSAMVVSLGSKIVDKSRWKRCSSIQSVSVTNSSCCLLVFFCVFVCCCFFGLLLCGNNLFCESGCFEFNFFNFFAFSFFFLFAPPLP